MDEIEKLKITLSQRMIGMMSLLPMPADGVRFMIYVARQHYSAEALAQRAQNRVAYFDAKYPDDRKIILVQ
jgi:hypothetical protein